LVLMALIALVWRRSFWDLHASILGLLLSVSLTTVFTQVVKVRFQLTLREREQPETQRTPPPTHTHQVCVGRPRPDLIDRCQPVEGATNAAVYGLATVAICTVQSGHIM
jgi:diacylglycerol diphosphate phosphatase/phosphatidate phosphatase